MQWRKEKKAILIIDMPNECNECPLFYDYLRCQAKECVDIYGEERPDNCPLKPIPKYYPSTSNPQRIEYLKQLGMTEKEQYYYELGHDDCVDEIIGEQE